MQAFNVVVPLVMDKTFGLSEAYMSGISFGVAGAFIAAVASVLVVLFDGWHAHES